MDVMMDREVFKYFDNPDIRIWRYMDFPKFVSMLDHRALYFPTADQFQDTFEGSLPHKVAAAQDELVRKQSRAIKNTQVENSTVPNELFTEMGSIFYSI